LLDIFAAAVAKIVALASLGEKVDSRDRPTAPVET
jgi:hypothetical protein